jgi:hypothetical protein
LITPTAFEHRILTPFSAPLNTLQTSAGQFLNAEAQRPVNSGDKTRAIHFGSDASSTKKPSTLRQLLLKSTKFTSDGATILEALDALPPGYAAARVNKKRLALQKQQEAQARNASVNPSTGVNPLASKPFFSMPAHPRWQTDELVDGQINYLRTYTRRPVPHYHEPDCDGGEYDTNPADIFLHRNQSHRRRQKQFYRDSLPSSLLRAADRRRPDAEVPLDRTMKVERPFRYTPERYGDTFNY